MPQAVLGITTARECRNVAGIDVLPLSPLTLHFEEINLIVADLSLY